MREVEIEIRGGLLRGGWDVPSAKRLSDARDDSASAASARSALGFFLECCSSLTS